MAAYRRTIGSCFYKFVVRSTMPDGNLPLLRYITRPCQVSYFRCTLSTTIPVAASTYQKEKWFNIKPRPTSGSVNFAVMLSIGVGTTLLLCYHTAENAQEKLDDDAVGVSKTTTDRPTYSSQDVSQHDSKDTGIWVSYGNGVYNITEFVDKHPGGDKILLAAGGSLEPFWLLYSGHQTKQILDMLETYRIGDLREEDRGQSTLDMEDPYANDPIRHPVLKPRSLKPFNAEPPPQLLVEKYSTPNEFFFVRNHLPVPVVDENDYRLEVCVPGQKTISLSLEDLKTKFFKHTIHATIQCAGNRRSEIMEVKPVKGLNWGPAAISNAFWSGAKLRDILIYAGLKDSDTTIKHIQFEGMDVDVTGVPYAASILMQKAMDPSGDVIVAYEMNAATIPFDHGFPVRIIAPGIVGARNVKWLARITASEEESDSHWQQNDYKGFSPSVDWDTVDFTSAPAIQELPVQSAICDPVNGSKVKLVNGSIHVKGYAWSGGGHQIIRVDVSSDLGKSWHTASLSPDNSPPTRSWAWRLWEIDLPVFDHIKNDSEIVLICKAVDSSYNVQPDTVPPIWNLRGVLNNSWHRINVTIRQ